MKKTIFNKPIVKEEFEEKKRQIANRELDTYNLKVDRIVSVLNKTEKDIVREYIKTLEKRFDNTRNEIYSLRLNQLYINETAAKKKERISKEKIYRDDLEKIRLEINSCVRWLNGDEKEDISFIPDIKTRKKYYGKSREEIIGELKKIEEGFDRVSGYHRTEEEKVLDKAIKLYEPVKERVDVIREMNELEKTKKNKTRNAIRDFLLRIPTSMLVSLPISTILTFALASLDVFATGDINNFQTFAFIEGACTILGTTGSSIHKSLANKKTEEAFNEAKSDLEKADLYEAITKSISRKK